MGALSPILWLKATFIRIITVPGHRWRAGLTFCYLLAHFRIGKSTCRATEFFVFLWDNYSDGKSQKLEVLYMTVPIDEKVMERIEKLAMEAEILLEEEDSRKDLKESRKIIKQELFNGPTKLKHTVPKGKRI